MINFTQSDLHLIADIAHDAGLKIMDIYKKKISYEIKSDLSPVTKADIVSNNLICSRISKIFPGIPILSEESKENFFLKNDNGYFWCIDPLDGTKEFINKNDEFTVNIALIYKRKPVLGVIYLPVKQLTYMALDGNGSYKLDNNKIISIKVRPQNKNNLTFLASKSHLNNETANFIKLHNGKLTSAGSSLKFTYIADGQYDVYPRFGPTMIWDTAAGHCILKEAGGHVISLETFKPLEYDIHQLINPEFIAMNEIFDFKIPH
jgi:3'(2'), 5'-bisphosphate nucleotidase